MNIGKCMATCAFVGTNPTEARITSGLPVTRAQFHEALVQRLWRRHFGHIPPLSAERLNTGACRLAVTDSPVTSKREWSLPYYLYIKSAS
jgi:hypothetical protein